MVKVSERTRKLGGARNPHPLLLTNDPAAEVGLKRKAASQPEEAAQLASKKTAPTPQLDVTLPTPLLTFEGIKEHVLQVRLNIFISLSYLHC